MQGGNQTGERFAVSESTVRLFGVDLVVCHLNTGERVITEDSLIELFNAMGDPNAVFNEDDVMAALRELGA